MTRNRRRRILFCDHTVSMSGGEIALLNLVRHLDRTRFDPVAVLFAHGPLKDRLREAGVPVHEVLLDRRVSDVRKDALGGAGIARSMLAPSALPFVLGLRRLVRRTGADIVHTNSLKSDILGGVAARLAGRPLIWHIRDRIADDYLPPTAARLVRLLCRVVPQRIIANSAATLETLALPASMTCGPRRRAFVVHDGMEVTQPPSAPAPGPPRIGLVGRIAPWKGQHVFLDAAAAVRRSFAEARFVIVGTTMFGEEAYERRVRAQCTALGLDDVVEFTGFVEDVSSVYASLTVLVHASTVPEPFGQVVLEGMMAARPVVATRGGGVVEIVEDGTTGMLVPMSDASAMAEAILKLLREPELAGDMAQRGRERAVAHFDIRDTARNVEAVYDSLLAAE